MLKKSLFVIFLVLFFDQFIKIWIKTHMFLGQEYHVIGNWFIIHFTENFGMAFGMEFAGNYGKLFLSIFRILAVAVIGWYLFGLTKKKDTPFGLVLSISLIFAGAIGNILDSAFYGLLFNDSIFQVAKFMPEGGGYGSFLYGRVVDMFYFPIIEGHFPHWIPFWGGEELIFFRPVFNLSDSSITVGVVILILFQKKFFRKQQSEHEMKEALSEQSEIKSEENPS